ncbi:hypothetical protein MMC28_006336 [Mycoblastus sanguinarius]|nr:hypothetical protein [Mycoblastus sanguinarius]
MPTPPTRTLATQKDTVPGEQAAITGDEPASNSSLTSKAAVETDTNDASNEKATKTRAQLNNALSVSPTTDESKAPTLVSSKVPDKKQRPDMLDIAAAKDVPKKDVDPFIEPKKGTSKTDRVEGLSLYETSQPPTPATAVSQTSASSAARPGQPRTVRGSSTPKAETPLYVNAASPGVSQSSVASKQASRRPSFTSIHRPGTPASERFSDNASFTSTSISRANSPPPSRVGTAPIRQVTKSQQKKERQARAKLAEDTAKAEEPSSRAEEPVQAPILGRKKKAKKTNTQSTADSTPTVTRPTSPVLKEQVVEEKAEPAPVTPVRENKKTAPKAADVKEADTSSSPATPAAGEQQKTAVTAASIFASLLTAGEISAAVSDLFKGVHGLNYRVEGIEPKSIVNEDLIVSESQMQLLEQGEAIRIDKGPNNIIVVLPTRLPLHGLSAEQASRYLDLWKQAGLTGNLSSFNKALDRLSLMLPPASIVATRSKTQGGITSKLVNKFAAPTPAPGPTNSTIQKSGVGVGFGDESTRNVSHILSVNDAEQALLDSRKKTEFLEKKLNALLKKNRRLLFGNAH